MVEASNPSELEARVAALEREVSRVSEYYELSFSYKSTNPEAALWQARKAAEAICQSVFRQEISSNLGKLTLEKLIQMLAKEGLLPEKVAINLKAIQAYGNYGSHAQVGDPHEVTSEDVVPCLTALSLVIDWYFVEHLGQPTRRSDRATHLGQPALSPSSQGSPGQVPTLSAAGGEARQELPDSVQLEPNPPSSLREAEQLHRDRLTEIAAERKRRRNLVVCQDCLTAVRLARPRLWRSVGLLVFGAFGIFFGSIVGGGVGIAWGNGAMKGTWVVALGLGLAGAWLGWLVGEKKDSATCSSCGATLNHGTWVEEAR